MYRRLYDVTSACMMKFGVRGGANQKSLLLIDMLGCQMCADH